MSEKISPFVQTNKPWFIRKTLADYLRAKNMFFNMDRIAASGQLMTFEDLKKLSDILYTIKEDFHLIFRRLVNPQKNRFETAGKFTPNQDELDFINNVGLLFHKSMAARELKYVMEIYSVQNEDYTQSKDSLETYWKKMRILFSDGTEIIKRLLVDYTDNIIVLSYLLENDRYVHKALGENVKSILKRILGKQKIETAYIRVAEFLIESGWKERARRMLGEAVKINPDNSKAKKLLKLAT
jgi:hypothetical protein